MENKRMENVLMGFTTEGTMVMGNFRIRKGVFSASFDEVSPFIATEDTIRDRVECYTEDMDCECQLVILKEYDCKPSELIGKLYVDLYIDDIIDISLHSDSYRVEGVEDDIYFESVSCGQNDTRKFLNPIDRMFSGYIHDVWDRFHLEEVDVDLANMIIHRVENYIANLDEDKEIVDFLAKYFKQ